MARYKKMTIPRSLNPFKRIYEHRKTPFARLLRSPLSERFGDAAGLFGGSISHLGKLSKRGYAGIFDYLTLFIPHALASATEKSKNLPYFIAIIPLLTPVLLIDIAFILLRLTVTALALLVGAPFIIATHHIAKQWDTSAEALEVKGDIIKKGDAIHPDEHQPATLKEYLEKAHLNINTVEIRKIKNKDETIELELGEENEQWLPGQGKTPTFSLRFPKNQFSKSQCAFFNYNVGLVLNELEHQYPSEDLEKLLTIEIGVTP